MKRGPHFVIDYAILVGLAIAVAVLDAAIDSLGGVYAMFTLSGRDQRGRKARWF